MFFAAPPPSSLATPGVFAHCPRASGKGQKPLRCPCLARLLGAMGFARQSPAKVPCLHPSGTKPVSCSALQAVTVFAKKKQKTPPALHFHIWHASTPAKTGAPSLPPVRHSQRLGVQGDGRATGTGQGGNCKPRARHTVARLSITGTRGKG